MTNRGHRGGVRSNPGCWFLWIQQLGSNRGSANWGDRKWHILKFSIGDWSGAAMVVGSKCESTAEIIIGGLQRDAMGHAMGFARAIRSLQIDGGYCSRDP